MADTKISALTAIASLATGDLVAVVDDPAGTPVTKKATVDQIGDYVRGEAATAELIRDTIGTALTAGSGISVTVNDGSDTITVAADGTAITALTAIASLATEDVFPVVDDPSGTPVTKKATMTQVATLMASELVSDTAYASSWNGVTDDAPSKNAVYDKFEAFFPTPVTTAWVTSKPYVHQFNNGSAMAADTIYYNPVWIRRRTTISDLGVRLNATTSANSIKIGIYANNASTNRPTGNVLAATGNISLGSTGTLSADISGADVTLDPGLYWFAIWAEGTTGSLASNGSCDWESQLIGDTNLGNVVGDNQNWGYTLTSAESWAGGTFPDATSEAYTVVPRSSAARTYAVFMKVV